MKKALIILLFATSLLACKSECEKSKKGTITVSNSSSNPYDFYIDGVFQVRLSGNSISEKIKVSQGDKRVFYVKQVSGYLLYPTERTKEFNVVSCSDYDWQIP